MFRPIMRIAFYLSAGGFIHCVWNPVNSGLLRLGLLLSLSVSLLVLGFWLWKIRRPLAVVPGLVFIPFLLPGGELDRVELRESYLESMRSMDGIAYYGGGESRRGIDCSGLPRLGMREALLGQWWNGRAWRMWAEMWWWDSSAKAMSEGFRGLTVETGVAGVLRELDEGRVEAGDLAVTRGGAHVMVYLGGGKWVQADPKPMKVVISRARDGESEWFDLQVSLYRWRVFDGSSG